MHDSANVNEKGVPQSRNKNFVAVRPQRERIIISVKFEIRTNGRS
jgi:hypothetical protein